jgi:hypothetical protein
VLRLLKTYAAAEVTERVASDLRHPLGSHPAMANVDTLTINERRGETIPTMTVSAEPYRRGARHPFVEVPFLGASTP